MADTQSPTPTPDDMHWGISYLREDLQDLRQESRDFRKEVAAEFAKTRDEASDFRKEMAAEFAKTRDEASDFRKEMAAEFAKVRDEAGDSRKEMAAEFARMRGEMATGFADLRKESAQQWRNSLLVMAGISGIFATITTTALIAFIRYQLPGG